MTRTVTTAYTSDRKHPAWFTGYHCGALACDGETKAQNIGECNDGCCDRYRCPICDAEFWVEWPD